jgi:hypothetical protein
MRAQIAASSGRFALNREIPVCAGLCSVFLRADRSFRPLRAFS